MYSVFPEKFLKRLHQIYPENYQNILENLSFSRIWSLRINDLYPHSEEVFEEFETRGIEIIPVETMAGVFIFDKKHEYAIKGSDAFYKGKIYLQSIASLLPVIILNPKKGENILDVCAAPWGKTTQISALQGGTGRITALEKNEIRHAKLQYNIDLQNAKNVVTHKIDAKKFLSETNEMFDKILLDVPCSAEGRFYSQNPKSYTFWSMENIQKKAKLQKELLRLAFDRLKSGGELVYSTCTIAPEENEMVVADFLRKNNNAEIVAIKIPLNDEYFQKNIDAFDGKNFDILNNNAIRIFPSKMTEWFFIAKIIKK